MASFARLSSVMSSSSKPRFSSPNITCNEHGYCTIHPNVQLCEQQKRGWVKKPEWVKVRDTCPRCEEDELKRMDEEADRRKMGKVETEGERISVRKSAGTSSSLSDESQSKKSAMFIASSMSTVENRSHDSSPPQLPARSSFRTLRTLGSGISSRPTLRLSSKQSSASTVDTALSISSSTLNSFAMHEGLGDDDPLTFETEGHVARSTIDTNDTRTNEKKEHPEGVIVDEIAAFLNSESAQDIPVDLLNGASTEASKPLISGKDILAKFPEDLNYVCGALADETWPPPAGNLSVGGLANQFCRDLVRDNEEFHAKLVSGGGPIVSVTADMITAFQKVLLDFATMVNPKSEFRIWVAEEANRGKRKQQGGAEWTDVTYVEVASTENFFKQKLQDALTTKLRMLWQRRLERDACITCGGDFENKNAESGMEHAASYSVIAAVAKRLKSEEHRDLTTANSPVRSLPAMAQLSFETEEKLNISDDVASFVLKESDNHTAAAEIPVKCLSVKIRGNYPNDFHYVCGCHPVHYPLDTSMFWGVIERYVRRLMSNDNEFRHEVMSDRWLEVVNVGDLVLETYRHANEEILSREGHGVLRIWTKDIDSVQADCTADEVEAGVLLRDISTDHESLKKSLRGPFTELLELLRSTFKLHARLLQTA